MVDLFKACGGLDKKTNVKIGSLVNLICDEDEEAQITRRALVSLANCTDVPIRENLQAKITGWQNGISKLEFLKAFPFPSDSIDKWSRVCLFYDMAVDNKVDLEAIVESICKAKNMTYQKPY